MTRLQLATDRSFIKSVDAGSNKPAQNHRPRIVLADDHTMLLDAFRRLLEPQCEIVGTACDGRALIELALKTNPEIIVLDISMPRLNGMDACAQLRRKLPASNSSSSLLTKTRISPPKQSDWARRAFC